jgi:serine protease Do
MPLLASVAFVLLALADLPAGDPPPATDPVAALESAVTTAIAKAEPSVVAISREKNPKGDETIAVRGHKLNPPLVPTRAVVADELGLPQEEMSFDYGSGVVVGDEGQILTAFHVISGAVRIHVRAPGRQAFDAEVIAADPRSDLAVIVPRADQPAPTLKPIRMGDSDKLRKGSFLLALGNSFNAARHDGAASASLGILSNVARRTEPPPSALYGPPQLRHYPTLLQLDSKLNLGMSGGAVVNLKGELVGLTTSAASVYGFDIQAGYAIPMDTLGRGVVETLKRGKEAEYGFLGIELDHSHTNRVESTGPGTPAGEGGVRSDDYITSVGGLPVSDSDTLALAINAMPVGVPVKLTIRRQNVEIERTVVLAKFPIEGEVIATNRPPPWRGLRVDYTSMLPTAPFGRQLLTAMAKGGVCITEVVDGSESDVAGLKKDQVITAVDDRHVRSPAEFADAVANADGPVKLTTDQGPVVIKGAAARSSP